MKWLKYDVKHQFGLKNGMGYGNLTLQRRLIQESLDSYNTPLRFVMEYELEGPSAKWSSIESTSRLMSPRPL